jgi:hypothetical protein
MFERLKHMLRSPERKALRTARLIAIVHRAVRLA